VGIPGWGAFKRSSIIQPMAWSDLWHQRRDKTTPDSWKYGATAHGAVIDAEKSLVRG